MRNLNIVSIEYPLMIIVTFLKFNANANDILEEREVVCSSDRMVVNLSFRRPFNGLVFVQGQFHEEKCKWRGNGGHYLLVVLPLQKMGQPKYCGVQFDQSLGEHSVMLVVSHDPQILTQQSLALAVSCARARKEQMLTLTIGAPSVDPSFRTMEHDTGSSSLLLGKPPPVPPISLQILDGHGLTGTALNEATIGQRLTLDVMLSDDSVYDMLVHNCVAHDGSKSGDASLLMVDENGCALGMPRAVDTPLMLFPATKSSHQAPAAKHAYLHFYGFQFTSGPLLHFECQLALCVGCGIEQCRPETTFRGNPSVRIATRSLKTQLHMRPQILQPIAVAPTMRMERLVAADPRARAIYYGLSCTDLAWLLLLATFGLLICVAILTILKKLRTIFVGIFKAMKA